MLLRMRLRTSSGRPTSANAVPLVEGLRLLDSSNDVHQSCRIGKERKERSGDFRCGEFKYFKMILKRVFTAYDEVLKRLYDGGVAAGGEKGPLPLGDPRHIYGAYQSFFDSDFCILVEAM
jgi:hypothetical protein